MSSVSRNGRALLIVSALVLAACEREDRPLSGGPIPGEQRDAISLASNSPGPSGPVEKKSPTRSDYEKVAFHVSQGKKLFTWYNCAGCHANGGGGSGPALMDDVWIYGSASENIAASIREGRPDGMPPCRGEIPADQKWPIAAHVPAPG